MRPQRGGGVERSIPSINDECVDAGWSCATLTGANAAEQIKNQRPHPGGGFQLPAWTLLPALAGSGSPPTGRSPGHPAHCGVTVCRPKKVWFVTCTVYGHRLAQRLTSLTSQMTTRVALCARSGPIAFWASIPTRATAMTVSTAFV